MISSVTLLIHVILAVGVVLLFAERAGDSLMAQKDSIKPLRVAVVGLPSSTQGLNQGAGKSCLCNRFTRSDEDNFSINHSSVLNHEDFTGEFMSLCRIPLV